MTPPHKCDFVRRQLPRGPSCQCHALLSYKPRPRPVFRPEAPRECVEELFDEIFRMGTSILIRLGVPIPPVEMAYFDFLNELDAQERTPQHQVDIRQHSEPRIDQDALPETLSGFQYFSTDIVAEPLHTGQQLPFDPFNGPLPELQYPETNADAEPSPQDQPQQEPRLQFPSVPPPDEQPTKACAAIQPQPNPIVRYITGDQLKVMGWKDLFMLARVSIAFANYPRWTPLILVQLTRLGTLCMDP